VTILQKLKKSDWSALKRDLKFFRPLNLLCD
jgi:hypothetical protein